MTPGYFRTMGTRLTAGRLFDARDRAGSLPVVIVNERLARWAWPGQSPLGRRIRVAALSGGLDPAPWWTVVGVVADVRYRELTSAPLDVYVPFEQSPFPPADLLVRARGEPQPALGAIRTALRTFNPEGVVSITRMEDEVAAHQAPWRTSLVFFAVFAALTVLLVVVGVYAMLNALVVERTRDVGVRVALGATAGRILGEILADGARVVAAGMVAGALATAAVSQFVAALLFEVSALDRLAIATSLTLVAVTGLLACAVPAMRAARLDPVQVLRAD
jgi:hypothetical protein